MMTTAAMMNPTSVNAIGHEHRPDSADLDIERWKLNVGRFLFTPKKYRPPRPMDAKGGCSPQNNRGKLRC